MPSEKWTREAAHLECQKMGYEMQVTSWQSGRRSKDLFGCIDAIAIPRRKNFKVLAIQYTSRQNIRNRVNKVKAATLHGGRKVVDFLKEDLGMSVVVWGFDTRDGELRLKSEEL